MEVCHTIQSASVPNLFFATLGRFVLQILSLLIGNQKLVAQSILEQISKVIAKSYRSRNLGGFSRRWPARLPLFRRSTAELTSSYEKSVSYRWDCDLVAVGFFESSPNQS